MDVEALALGVDAKALILALGPDPSWEWDSESPDTMSFGVVLVSPVVPCALDTGCLDGCAVVFERLDFVSTLSERCLHVKR